MKIDVNTAKLDSAAASLMGLEKRLGEYGNRAINIGKVLQSMDDYALLKVSYRLNLQATRIAGDRIKLHSMSTVLTNVSKQYKNTEKAITSIRFGDIKIPHPSSSSAGGAGGPYEIDSIVFDKTGSYGGNQGHMASKYKQDPSRQQELLKDLKKYFPNMTTTQGLKYLERLNSVGCGYVALVNTIFMKFAHDPAGFQRIFGFPMYNHGDLNYDRMIMDLYCTTDLAGINDISDGMPGGTSDHDRARIVSRYLASKGIATRTQANVKVTPDNVRSILKSNDGLIIGYRNDNLYNEDGSKACTIKGGHAMTVTGVTDDGRYIVSSWGDKYYIPASEVDAGDTFMTFNYFQTR